MENEEEPLCKVIHVSTQQFYQAEPAMKELEDKVKSERVYERLIGHISWINWSMCCVKRELK